jgi:hypothetical protein
VQSHYLLPSGGSGSAAEQPDNKGQSGGTGSAAEQPDNKGQSGGTSEQQFDENRANNLAKWTAGGFTLLAALLRATSTPVFR